MKKRLIFLALLSLFSFSITAQSIESNDNSLFGQIQKAESKKKEVLDNHSSIIDARTKIVNDTAVKITDKKSEIYNKPYRTAELLEDGVTPSELALNRREKNYQKAKEEFIASCETEIKATEDSLLSRHSSLMEEINGYYDNLETVKISTKGNELSVVYSGYDGGNVGWNFNVYVKGLGEEIKTEGFLSFEELTGKDPLVYSEEDFDGFCDSVDYYTDLFSTGKSESLFVMECGAFPLDVKYPSQYKITLDNLTWSNDKFTGNVELSNSETVISLDTSYDLQPALKTLPEISLLVEDKVEAMRFASLGLYFSPVSLPAGTDGSAGKDGKYVLFGYWPQSLKTDDVTVNESESEEINGWICYKGSDGFYYVKEEATPHYNGYNGTYDGKFDNGQLISKDTYYYFKLEPIKWRIVTDDYQGGSFLVAENILDNVCFDKKHEPRRDDYWGDIEYNRLVNGKTVEQNNYKYSTVRAYLNGLNGSNYDVDDFTDKGFINKAFSSGAAEKINTVTVDNSGLSTTDSSDYLERADTYSYQNYTCDNTKDKIFLLSEREVTESSYGFDGYDSHDIARRRKATDYSKAKGVWVSSGEEYSNNGCWWLRTPYSYYYNYGSLNSRIIDAGGLADEAYTVSDNSCGVAPALSISSDYFSVPEVTDLVVTPTDKKLMFSWTNPDDDNFEKTVVSVGSTEFELKGEKGSSISRSISGLKADSTFDFTVKTVTKNGIESLGLTIKDVVMKDAAPGNVLNAAAVAVNGSASISWTNPDDLDFYKVIISGDGFKNIEVKGNAGTEQKLDLNNLTNGKLYSFEIKTVDKAGNVGQGVQLEFSPINLYENPVLLPAGTDGSAGTDGKYVLFGMWPQTVKSDDVTINSDTKEINGWTCYKGSDSCYYVKAKADTYSYDYEFDNGSSISDGTEYYFKLEPVKWRIVTDDYQGGNLLLAENVLLSKRFDDGYSYSNNYKNSEIRAWLNGDFINKAFTPEAISKISVSEVDNSADSTTDSGNNIRRADYYYADCICENTYDKIFLLSEKEVTDSSYGFGSYDEYDETRRKQSTDYSKATGAYVNTEDRYKNNSPWWLRSPYYDYNYEVLYVDSYCDANNDRNTDSGNCGVVPALSISSDYFPCSEVTDLVVTPTDKKLMFSWKNPDDDSFEKTLVSIGDTKFELKGEKGSVISRSISGLKADSTFDFTVKTVSKGGIISDGITSEILFKDVVPSEVKEAKADPGDKEVSISWTNPADLDFDKVIISITNFKDIEIKGSAGAKKQLSLKKLTNGKTYSVVIKTSDKAGNVSEGVRFEFVPEEKITTDSPVLLPAGTDGSYGTEGTYVLFGDWPQSVKADNVTVSSDKKYVNGWECYKGSDDCYYVKAEADTYDSYYFNNGKRISDGTSYYFKLEPIKWRVLTDDYQGGKLLVAENVLAAKRFAGYYNNYKNSEIRSWLNDGFINSAFKKEAIESINTVTVDNSVKSTGYSYNAYACENTSDKIFLLSQEEVTESSYGFDSDEDEYDIARRRKTTDYSRATGAYSYTYDEENKNNGWWWLRSPDYNDCSYARGVGDYGDADRSDYVDNTRGGVVPALSISF